jgi:putative membrane protein
MKDYKEYIGLAVLVFVNLIGVIGFRTESLLPLFKTLTPYNLLFTLVICFLYLSRKTFISNFILLFTIGFGVEFLGVKTGLLFGNYEYGSTLGIKLLDVPLIIGVNWFVLAVGARGCANGITKNTFYQVLCAALFMVGLDFLIEPVAMKYDFWDWHQNKVPIQNYFMWFLISLLMQVILTKKSILIPFSLGFVILISQFIFFGALL